ncbi:MAG: HlyD family efflux transporter periplasmic adaptor subunit [Reichenbachiella sp.]|uniref:HlyD family efflux transporter periplasmic adaptor subunit n=1 Tax=Reichenbachiella sp. TaxID=2184521 RepID=UPI0029660894|nr:HlyD family efflux transporter periplasmic adaptor subunit [Reichenbachiella sp.]MDW3208912.1 HlyD family efflux transporter periplasmic adaptor subunit [Reichenbachiella sp.]
MSNLKIVSKEEIIGAPPSWLTRSGSHIILILIIFALGMSKLVKYPEVISSSITISATNKPISILANSSGYIANISVEEGQLVNQGEILCEVENEINYESINDLKNYLDKYEKWKTSLHFNQFETIELKHLGNIQNAFDEFNLNIKKYNIYLINNTEVLADNKIKDEIEYLKSIIEQKKILIKVNREKLDLTKKWHKKDSSLFSIKALSEKEYEKSKMNLITESNYLATTKIDLISLESTLKTKLNERQSVAFTILHNNLDYQMKIQGNLNILKSLISSWEYNYILRASIYGKLTYQKLWEKNQFINKGDEFATLIPLDNKVFGYSYISELGYGKISLKDKVIIKLNDYPSLEYGSLIGIVSHISIIRKEEGYLLKVEFPEGMKTNYDKSINFFQDMTGTMEIVTEDISLFDRFFNRLRTILNY